MSIRIAIFFIGLLALRCRAQEAYDLDPAFRTGIGSEVISSVIPLEDGRVLVAGRFDYPGSSVQLGVGRLQADGTWDQGFEANNYMAEHLQLCSGLIYGQNTTVRRLLPDGQLDPSFIGMNTGPYFSSGLAGDFFVYPDGRVLLGGTHTLHDTVRGYTGAYNLIWFSNQGYLDTTQHHRACDGHIRTIHPLPDGKFLLSGFWSVYDGASTPNSTHLIRVLPDGALDPTFQCPITWGSIVHHSLLPDGKHLVTGLFRVADDPDTLQIVRLLPNGGLDPGFDHHIQLLYSYGNLPAYASIDDLLPIGNGGMVIVGAFTSVAGLPRGGIAALDSTGHALSGPFTGAACGAWYDGFSDRAYISGIVPAPDGKLFIHGSYHGYSDGTTNDALQRMVSRLYGLDVGVDEAATNAIELSVFPNPTGDHLRLRSQLLRSGTVTIADALGRTVLRAPWRNEPLDVRTLRSGVYHLALCDEHGRPVAGGRFLKE